MREQVCLVVKSDIYQRMITWLSPETREYLESAKAFHRNGWTLLYWENTIGWRHEDIVDDRVDQIITYIHKKIGDKPRNYQLMVYGDGQVSVQGNAVGNPFHPTPEVQGHEWNIRFQA